MRLSYAVNTVRGNIRSVNQDNYYLNGHIKEMDKADSQEEETASEKNQMFAVCDGMGGEQFGELASFTAVKEMLSWNKEEVRMDWVSPIRQANRRVCEEADDNYASLGTTFAGIILGDKNNGKMSCYAANVGDTRVYRIRNKEILQISHDHTKFQNLVDQGFLKKEDFSKSNAHNILMQNLGIEEEEMLLSPHEFKDEAYVGDRYLICSDGLYGVVPEEQILAFMQKETEAAEICRQLVETALKQKSRDNVTAMIICVEKENMIGKIIRNLFSK